MSSLFLVLMLMFSSSAYSYESKTDEELFWPPDLVPHPHLPGNGPSGPPEPEIA